MFPRPRRVRAFEDVITSGEHKESDDVEGETGYHD
jgi:hypothetical protein